jgi:hypothetical protein
MTRRLASLLVALSIYNSYRPGCFHCRYPLVLNVSARVFFFCRLSHTPFWISWGSNQGSGQCQVHGIVPFHLYIYIYMYLHTCTCTFVYMYLSVYCRCVQCHPACVCISPTSYAKDIYVVYYPRRSTGRREVSLFLIFWLVMRVSRHCSCTRTLCA